MGVVDHHDGAVFFGESGELVDGADVAIHRKDAVGDEEFAARLVLDFAEQLFGVGDVFVAEDFDLRAGEAGAVDDGGVIELVGDDEVFFAEDSGDGAGVGGESALEDDAGFDILEAGDFLLQLHVDFHGSGDGANGAGADTVVADGLDGGFTQFGVIAEAEIVVGGEIDDPAAVVGADRGLDVVEDAQAKMGALLPKLVELGGEVLELGAFGEGSGHGRTSGDCEWATRDRNSRGQGVRQVSGGCSRAGGGGGQIQ